MPTDRLAIEARELGMREGASFTSSLMGGQTVDRCRFVAVVYRPGSAGAIIAWQEFNRWGTEQIASLSGVNYRNAQQAHHLLDSAIREAGWAEIDLGPNWYNVRFEMHYDKGDAYDQQMTRLVTAAREDELARQLAVAKRGSIAGRVAAWSGLIFISGLALQLIAKVTLGDNPPGPWALVSLTSCLSVAVFVTSGLVWFFRQSSE